MSARHTPGPWKVERIERPLPYKGFYWNNILADVENRESGFDVEATICEAYTEEDLISQDAADANARLIAAAPDLLDALSHLVGVADAVADATNCGDMDAAILTARAAIAKAECSE